MTKRERKKIFLHFFKKIKKKITYLRSMTVNLESNLLFQKIYYFMFRKYYFGILKT